MTDAAIEKIVERTNRRPIPLHSLMPRRVRNILLVSSLYDLYTFEEDGRLTEVLFSEYLELNLRYAPNIERVSTAKEALDRVKTGGYDLVISMTRVGDMDIIEFGTAVKKIDPDIPIVLLAYHTRELQILQARSELPGIDRVFVWHGDVRIFLAIIKSIEDRLNVEHDATVAGVKCIILIEDSVDFYSSYLPMLYTELVTQTQGLMVDGLNRIQKLIRMRARPKILLATTYEEGLELYTRYKNDLLGIITDARIPRNGVLDPIAGIDFARMVRTELWDQAVLVQSSDPNAEELAKSVEAHYINKQSPTLLNDVRDFMRSNLGFGDFVFKLPDGTVVARADDIRSLTRAIADVPEESLVFHSNRNDFSTWLMARTEFDLAKALRPRRIDEFRSISHFRKYFRAVLDRHRKQTSAGVVAEFSKTTFDAESTFVRIGDGSLGGKGRGLAFVNSLLNMFRIEEHIPGVHIHVPSSTVVTTGIFDRFMEESGLMPLALGDAGDEEISKAFLAAPLPEEAVSTLRTLLSRVRYPLSIRSSSQLEDASYEPFAGVYKTFMIPNNQENIEIRLEELCNAIRLIYASTYYSASKEYFMSTPNRLEEEKMAVIIQQLVGRQHGDYLYPDIAGIARSYDFYPMEGMDSHDGVVQAVLGLGKTVVEGGRSVRFSPAHPRKSYQFSSTEDTLENAQREFLALDLTKPGPVEDSDDAFESSLVNLGLDIAEKHGTIHVLASTYSPENDAVYDGTSVKGVRLITLAGVLKQGVFPLAEVLSFLLKVGSAGFSCPVEIEFAVNLHKATEEPTEFGFLQIRPMVVSAETMELDLDDIDVHDALCITSSALGQGKVGDVRDVVYVRRDRFNRHETQAIAGEIEDLNRKLKSDNRPYLLIGPGRWGTADRFYGIPVKWAQISGVRCIVETDIEGISVAPSQGTHFFHNMTSFGIGYFTVNKNDPESSLNLDWLDSQPAATETEHVRHLQFEDPLWILMAGKTRHGAIMKPGYSENFTSVSNNKS